MQQSLPSKMHFLSHSLLILGAAPSVLAVDRKPSGPVHAGQPSNCVAWHTVREGDDCNSVPQKYYITREEFLAWNPAVSEDCTENFWLKSAYCVAVDESKTVDDSDTSLSGTTTKSAIGSKTGKVDYTETPTVETTKKTTKSSATGSLQTPSHNATVSSTTTYSVRHPVSTWNITTPTIDKTWPPKATQAGQPSECNKWHLVRGGQTCRDILNTHSAFMKKEEL